jgi:ABC-type polysaccharide/polyol phosphate transport system ATPase subunit
MNSTSSSKTELDKDVMVKIENLGVSFDTNYYKTQSLRDKFISIMNHPIREILGVSDQLTILEDINLEVKRGDRLGIMGINGSGKTTLCRSISGMFVPQVGTVQVNGEVRAIFDTNVGILPELTGRENAHLLASLIYPYAENKEELIEDAIQFSELGHYIDTPFRNYSKGMQARLCLSLISAIPCDILILDEVYDGADMFFQKKIAARVLDMITHSGAVIFVTHAFEQIREACNRIIVINDKKIIYDGDIEGGIKVFNEEVPKLNDY